MKCAGLSGLDSVRRLTTRLRASLLTAGASRLVSLPMRSMHRAGSDCQASLEEAAVNRPGRKRLSNG
jgi:hypothetical protein